MTKYVVGVSGGVDSVVLLHKMIQAGDSVVVAHFDHGIRHDSSDDATFVRELAKQYGARFVQKSESLGAQASEERARSRRYAFLKRVAADEQATLVTAHHADDIVETIAINIVRGTGWRGLAVLGDEAVYRPLVDQRKKDILDYAAKHALAWREDSTNQSDAYLRNRLRRRLSHLDDETRTLFLQYWQDQIHLRTAIDTTTRTLLEDQLSYSRYFFTHCTQSAALELLRQVGMQSVGRSLTHPQRQKLLHSIKVARPGSLLDVATGVRVKFSEEWFIVVTPTEVI